MPSIGSAYRGPLVIIGLGSGFSVVGAVPVAITFSIGVRTSATIIGMGFVGFGFLLILPGLFWCVMVRMPSFKFWNRKKRTPSEEEETTPTLNCSVSSKSDVRERHWPPSDYNSAPPLLSPCSYDPKPSTNCSSEVLLVNADISATPMLDNSALRTSSEDLADSNALPLTAMTDSKDSEADELISSSRLFASTAVTDSKDTEADELVSSSRSFASTAVTDSKDRGTDELVSSTGLFSTSVSAPNAPAEVYEEDEGQSGVN